MRGSFSPSASCEESTSLTASLTLRIRAPAILVNAPDDIVGRDETSLDHHAVGKLRHDVALELRGGVVHHRRRATNERSGERGALPKVVMIGLGHRGAEAPLQMSLQRDDLLALALQGGV